ncbi:MAG: hydrogenase expression/formation protein HypE [Isosphaeraceae bacterium]|jgi:hydrogenase expression/formation protein HypE|nr:MAG: hydrogenase expression/formation protein HypE [Isosphaeraceae bacterium]
MNSQGDWNTCPLPLGINGETLLLAHGEGARATRRLIRELLVQPLSNEFLAPLDDAAVLPDPGRPIVLSTDSYVVSPLFFPGGDIGRLAVHGTINDLAVCGAEPLYLSMAIIAEEGLAIDTLRRVVESVRDAARDCGVWIVTGDTKVVPRGAADGVFLNTTGLGRLRPGVRLGAERVQPGDRILVSGTIGDHGLAILAARERFDLGEALVSDTAPLHRLVARLLDSGADVKFLRDPTRGGVSAACHELSEATGHAIRLDESSTPVSEAVRGACELLGLDPFYVANEGKLLAVVAEPDVDRALEALRSEAIGRNAAAIGQVIADPGPLVLVRGQLGFDRILDEPTGAPLPRIC